MSTSIESLELEIKSSSQSAISGIDALAGSLEKLKSATKGGVGLSSVAKQLGGISSGLTKINSSSISNIKALGDALKTLSGVKVSSTISKNISAIGTALSTLNVSGGASKITELVSSLKPLETLGKSSLSSTVNALNKLPDAISKIDTKKLYSQVQSLTRIMKPLADEMQKVANGFNAFPSRIQKLIKENDKLSSSNNKTKDSYINLAAKMRTAYNAIKTGAKWIGSAIEKSSDYTENVHLFNVAMGEYAGEARAYAEQVGEVMGIDPGEWMRSQGTFMTLATGFGVTGERAKTMSKNLTQLGYDLSSFFNLPYEEAMQKLESGLAGELEPLRRIGFDLSVARLQQEAYTLGINKKVSAMTQAEKAELRYYAIMTQVTTAHKDMSNTLDQPANQIRVLKSQFEQAGRAIGNIFIPMLQAVLPYAIAFVKVIRMVANELARLVGYEDDFADTSGFDSLTSGADDYSDALGGAVDNAKKLQQYTMGFDELNVIDPNKGNSDNSSGANLGGGFDFELPEYDFLGKDSQNKVNTIVKEIKDNLSTVLTIVGGIGAAIAGWAISKVITLGSALAKMAGLKFSGFTVITGLTLFLQDLTTLKKYIDDFKENGASFYNVSGIISTFAGLVGDALILLGNVKVGGALKVIEGIGQIVGSIADMSNGTVNWTNVTSAINGLSNVAIGIGVFTGNLQLTGGAMAVQGLTTVIDEIKRNWEAIKNGDWSGVDKAALAIGAIEAIGGVVIALGAFSKIKKATNTAEVGKEIAEVGNTASETSTSVSQLTSKLKDLAKNLALGIVIIAEVAVAAGLVVGAIWGLGVLLDQTAQAWQPVIDNAGTVAIAVGVGTALLVGIGVVTAVLGNIGTSLIVQLALGIAMLALLGVSAALFLGEIILIGTLLNQINIAWTPVLKNGKPIATAIGIGTALLIAIGVVAALLGVAAVASCGMLPLAIALGTAMLLELGLAAVVFLAEIINVANALVPIAPAWQPVLDNGEVIEQGIARGTVLLTAIGVVAAALGVAAVASVGLLPVAIALGTAMLVDLAEAFIKFCDKLTEIAKKLSKNLAPALRELNAILPTMETDMISFTAFMGKFALAIVAFTAESAIASIAATIDKVISFFTADPVTMLYDEVTDQTREFEMLIPALEKINPMIERATELVGEYKEKMGSFENATGGSGGFLNSIVNGAKGVINGLIGLFEGMANGVIKCINFIVDGLNKIEFDVPNWVPIIGGKKFGFNIAHVQEISIPRLATGGMVETGQMFIAREAGPEMVGSIGRNTAVANNDQIVAGIASGVASANSESNSLLREQNSLLRALLEKESGVYLDGKSITKSVEKHQRERGRVLVTGGAY